MNCGACEWVSCRLTCVPNTHKHSQRSTNTSWVTTTDLLTWANIEAFLYPPPHLLMQHHPSVPHPTKRSTSVQIEASK